MRPDEPTLIGKMHLTTEFRVYPLDPYAPDSDATTIVVLADDGPFDVFNHGMSTWIALRGYLNGLGVFRLGDGLMVVNQSDIAMPMEVQTVSRMFGEDEWAELLASPTCTDGHDDQRLRFEPLREG